MKLHRLEAPDNGSAGGGGAPAPSPPAPPPPAPASWYGDLPADAPQDFRDWVGNKNFKDAPAALLSAFNFEKLMGADKAGRTVLWPKDEADKDGWAAINAKLGVPGKPEEYGLAAAQGEDANFVTEAAKWMHARGIPKAAAAGLIDDMRKYGKQLMDQAMTTSQAESQAALDALHTKWGTAKDQNTAQAKRFAGELGLSAEDMSAIEGAIGTAKFMEMMHAGGTKLGEIGGQGNGAGSGGFGITQAAAREQLDAARAKRAKGEMSERDWHEIDGKLGPIAYPSAAA